MDKKYTAKYFKDNMPDWKKKKDPFIAQICYRPLSFGISAFCANKGISANTVSYISIIPAALAVVCFFTSVHWLFIVGAALVNIWLLMDCVDGNIARSVRKQPFGEFADACSSFLLVALLYIGIGYACYVDGGLLFSKGNTIIIVLAGVAVGVDAFMRFVYYKYREMILKIGRSEAALTITNGNVSIKERVSEAIGIGGYQPIIILTGCIFYFLDIIVLVVLLINCVKCLYVVSKTITKAIRITREIETMEQITGTTTNKNS